MDSSRIGLIPGLARYQFHCRFHKNVMQLQCTTLTLDLLVCKVVNVNLDEHS